MTQPLVDMIWSDSVTSYDRAHHMLYLRLIDAVESGVSDVDMCRMILDMDPDQEPERSAKALASHVQRAFWMMETGYRELLAI